VPADNECMKMIFRKNNIGPQRDRLMAFRIQEHERLLKLEIQALKDDKGSTFNDCLANRPKMPEGNTCVCSAGYYETVCGFLF
jgi:hypothetical protein